MTSDIAPFLETIAEDVAGKPDELIKLLQACQRELGFLSESILLELSRLTGQTPANIFGVATFYSQFRFQPVGKHLIKVCCGTACHVKGSERMLDCLMECPGIAPGETSEDGLFSLETVACFGSCALAPVVVIDDTVYGSMNRQKVIELIEDIRSHQLEFDQAL